MKADIIFKVHIEDGNATVKMDMEQVSDIDTTLFTRLLKLFNDTSKKVNNEINKSAAPADAQEQDPDGEGEKAAEEEKPEEA